MIGGILMIILAPYRGGTLFRWRFHDRGEYEADATGARISGNPLALASALKETSGRKRSESR